jgi:neutral ceramidase
MNTSFPTSNGLYAGAAGISINPPLPADPQGYIRRAKAVRRYADALEIRALALKSNETAVIILAADVVDLDQTFSDEIRRQVSDATGVPVECVLLNSSHSHAALWPKSTGKIHGEFVEHTPAELAYFARIPFDYATAASLALAALAPVRVSGGTGKAPGLAVNRRERTADGRTILGWNREAFVDEEVPTIRIDGLDGKAVATIVGFGCHPVCVGPEVEESATDFVGPLRRTVETIRGGLCLYLQGAAGNVLPLQAFCDFTGPEVAMGARLGLEAAHCIADRDPIARKIKKIEYGSVTPISLYRRAAIDPQPPQLLASRRAIVDLPLLTPPTRDELADELARRQLEFKTKEAEGAPRPILNPIRYHLKWLEAMLSRLEDGPLSTSLKGEIWATRMGDVAIVATPGEIFTEIGYDVRRQSPFRTTIFAGYSQAVLGYVPTAAEYPHGGYEPSVAQRGYWHPAPFSPEVVSIIASECSRLLRELAAMAPV